MNRVIKSLAIVVTLVASAFAGGPLWVGGPGSARNGQPILWDVSSPIPYRVDGGPLGKLSNDVAVARVQMLFQRWQDVPTANITYVNAGPILGVADGDVSTADEFDATFGSCQAGAQNPIIFDADGSLFEQVGIDPTVIGFAGMCSADLAAGQIKSAWAVLNGRFIDGVNAPPNYELSDAAFNGAFVHEFGHFSGLDHSQINLECLTWAPWGGCSADQMQGVPLMFPIEISENEFPRADDIAWISYLYPETNDNGTTQIPFSSTYGVLTGRVYNSSAKTQWQGLNMIARLVDDTNTPEDESLTTAFSGFSGYLFTGHLGQTTVGNNQGSPYGSHDVSLLGYFSIPVKPGSYKLGNETIYQGFVGGSKIGPLYVPRVCPGACPDFWNITESAGDFPMDFDLISVQAGQTVSNLDIILNGTFGDFDGYEGEASAK